MCRSVNRVVYVFGPQVREPPADITPTFLTTGVLSNAQTGRLRGPLCPAGVW
uniref:Uncharacterized protein n=1 Tax=Anguilla anguilla TaxID=7936 RepID=A0A0E9P6A7_ANGAN